MSKIQIPSNVDNRVDLFLNGMGIAPVVAPVRDGLRSLHDAVMPQNKIGRAATWLGLAAAPVIMYKVGFPVLGYLSEGVRALANYVA
jgi:hypothetical protein